MNTEEYSFELSKNRWSNPIPLEFKFATDGTPTESRTELSLSYTGNFFHIDFNCFDNPNVDENYYKISNEPLYNQEVFEVFISGGSKDPKSYLEVEINPNNAIWVGEIDNPSLGEQMQTIKQMIDPKESKIEHTVEATKDSWKGRLSIPWDLIGKSEDNQYRINFYRVRSIKAHHNKRDWICDLENCEFLCWSPTLSGESPAFHRPKMFGHMKLNG
jgi:hypothetical protein